MVVQPAVDCGRVRRLPGLSSGQTAGVRADKPVHKRRVEPKVGRLYSVPVRTRASARMRARARRRSRGEVRRAGEGGPGVRSNVQRVWGGAHWWCTT
eukprot:scaffold22731_cov64-Phaeocystis_antarctica.AAC.3